MNGDSKMHKALETVEEAEGRLRRSKKLLRRKRIEVALESFLLVALSATIARGYTEKPIIWWFFFTFAAVFLGLGIWDITKLLGER